MKNLLLILIVLSIGLTFPITSNGQVKMSEYKPLNFNEMLFAPSIKSRKYNENLDKLKGLESKVIAYVEVYEDDFDDVFKRQMVEFIQKFNKVADGDLAIKDVEIEKLSFQFNKICKDFEWRRNQNASIRAYQEGKSDEINDHLFFHNKSPVYDSFKIEGGKPSGKLIGELNGTRVFVLSAVSEDFFKVKIGDRIGYIQKKYQTD